MNVTMLSTSFPEYQGDLAGVFIAHLAQELIRQQVSTRVIAPHSPQALKEERIEGVPVSRVQYMIPAQWQRVCYGNGLPANIKTSTLAKIGLAPLLLRLGLKTLALRHETDVYHAHWILSGLIALAGRPFHRKPIVLTIRGSDLNLLQGKFIEPFLHMVLRRVSAVTTVSEKLQEKVLALGVNPECVSTIPNGVDCQTFAPRPSLEARRALGLPQQAAIILWVGRFVPIKGVEFLVNAMPDVVAQIPNALFVLVGNGELESDIRQQIAQHGLQSHTHLAGKIASDRIVTWLNAADILVLPSLNEGRPNVVLEAMACERPIVATQVGGIPELLQNGETGLLVPPADSAQLAQQLLHLLQNAPLRHHMGQRGREQIFKMKLSWQQCAACMKELYQRVIEESTP